MKNSTDVMKERRKHHRFKADSHLLVVSSTNILGRVDDLSLGGISFHYFQSEDEVQHLQLLDIMLHNDGLLAKDIPFSLLEEKKSLLKYGFDFQRIKRCRGAFIDCPPEKCLDIAVIIADHCCKYRNKNNLSGKSFDLANQFRAGEGPA